MAFHLRNGSEKNTARANPALAGTDGAGTRSLTDDEFQTEMLQGVSRTFALTIPQLPAELERVVANAYLLCRMVDTIEDEPALSMRQKPRFYGLFLNGIADERAAHRFSDDLRPLLSSMTAAAEHELIRNAARVLGITRTFSPAQRDTIQRCVRIMADGMQTFQQRGEICTSEELDQYCYYVAGVVGEMLTNLFCLYSPAINKNHDQLMALAVSFGQGLQMTNILKDVWEDYERGACWLPREVFAAEGCDLRGLTTLDTGEGFGRGVHRLIGVAHRHLRNALDYTLLIAKEEVGIRKFCLWAIGFALLTLLKIDHHLNYRSGSEVKISRLSVKSTIVISEFIVQHDRMLTEMFAAAGHSLPLAPMCVGWSPKPLSRSSGLISRAAQKFPAAPSR